MNDPTPPRMTDQAPELLPCPFCGGTADFDRMGNARMSTIVRCDDCGCSLESGDTSNAGRSWNTRPTPAERASDPSLATLLQQIKDHVVARHRHADERLDRIEALCDRAIAQLERPSDAAVAWRYRHKDTEGWSMLKNGRDPTEWLKQWPNTEYEVEALAPMRPEAADEIERLRNQLDCANKALRGAMVVIECLPRPSEGLISNKLQAEFDRRVDAIRAAIAKTDD